MCGTAYGSKYWLKFKLRICFESRLVFDLQCPMSTFKEWAGVAIDDVLGTHGGAMHWQHLQTALVQRYFADSANPSSGFPLVACSSILGNYLLAELSEAQVSDDDDGLVRTCKSRWVADVPPPDPPQDQANSPFLTTSFR